MYLPPQATGTLTLLNKYGVFLIARLKAEAVTRDLVGDVKNAQAQLRSVYESTQAALRSVTEALAARQSADVAATIVLSDFNRGVLSLVHGRRDERVYRQFFPRGVTPVAEASVESKCDHLRRIGMALSREKDDFDAKRYQHELSGACAALDASIGELRRVQTSYDDARIAERSERNNWRKAYRVAHSRVTEIFPTDRRKRESFFHPGPKQKKRPEPESP